MSYFDIALIALVALFALVGLIKGAKKSLLSLFGFSAAFLAALFLAKPIGEALLGVDFIKSFVLNESGSLYGVVYGLISKITPDTSIYTGLVDPIRDVIAGYGAVGFTEVQAVSLYYTDLLFNVIVGVAFFIVARLVMGIVTMLIKSLIGDGKPTFIGRILGFAFGAVRGAIISAALLVIIIASSTFTFLPFMTPLNSELDKSVIAKPVSAQLAVVVDKATSIDNEYFLRIAALSPVEGVGDEEGGDPADEPTDETTPDVPDTDEPIVDPMPDVPSDNTNTDDPITDGV